MKHLAIFISFMVILTAFMFCKNLDMITGDDEEIALILGDTSSVPFGRKIINQEKNISLIFDDLLEDSRCPRELRCFVEGNARIRLKVNHRPVILNTCSKFQQDTVINNIYIKLIYLNPWPSKVYKYPQDQYIADLYIKEAD